ncbi:MAG: excinuclease ABC subunit UvrC [Candidatus Lokiarchaeota archaeon]|nr:excinuclease ABC subunit UvrC [Candidatus Lokiarchaeota archaeon]
MKDLELQRKSLPNETGIYLFRDKEGSIIYIGKALNLKKRVNQYFLKTKYNDPFYEEKIRELVSKIHSVEYIVTENEKEALLLENIQIKKHLPRYNVIMRDSKTYPWVAIFYSEDFPRIRVLRNPHKYSQKNVFMGPYTDKKEIIRILRDLRKIFPYCSCKKPVRRKKKPCLYYQLKLCPGPCFSDINKEEYQNNIKKIELFLKGETGIIKKQIGEEMEKAAVKQNYELAAVWRDKLEDIEHATDQQHVFLDYDANKDIIGNHAEDNFMALVVIHIREGRITNKDSFNFDLREKLVHKTEIFSSILEQYYQGFKTKLPDAIILTELSEKFVVLTKYLKDLKPEIQIRKPKDDYEISLIRITNKNAKVIVQQQAQMEQIRMDEKDFREEVLKEAKKILNLPNEPRIIEGFDISNIEGTDATGSMVYFLEGKPYNKNYRHFKIKSKSTPDDVAMMKEVIRRRYEMILKRNWELPDLIVVDGGKGQLNAGISVLKELGLEIPIIGLAKKYEEIYFPNQKDPIILPKNTHLLKLLQRVRNESHRFAVRLHKKQRKKRMIVSMLDDIEGVGPISRNKLLNHFGSVNKLTKASLEEVSEVVGKKLAKVILKELNE